MDECGWTRRAGAPCSRSKLLNCTTVSRTVIIMNARNTPETVRGRSSHRLLLPTALSQHMTIGAYFAEGDSHGRSASTVAKGLISYAYGRWLQSQADRPAVWHPLKCFRGCVDARRLLRQRGHGLNGGGITAPLLGSGGTIAALRLENAMLKSEADTMRQRLEGQPAGNGRHLDNGCEQIKPGSVEAVLAMPPQH